MSALVPGTLGRCHFTTLAQFRQSYGEIGYITAEDRRADWSRGIVAPGRSYLMLTIDLEAPLILINRAPLNYNPCPSTAVMADDVSGDKIHPGVILYHAVVMSMCALKRSYLGQPGSYLTSDGARQGDMTNSSQYRHRSDLRHS